MISQWQLTISHPATADWITAAAYLSAASVSVRAAISAKLWREAGENWFWRAIAAILLLSAVNELLDLQTLLTLVMRFEAKAYGWYEIRRVVQYAFVMVLAATSLLAGIFVLRLAWRAHYSVTIALFGVFLINLFVFLRAASIHHFVEIFAPIAQGIEWTSYAETTGILIIMTATMLYSYRSGRREDR